MRKHGDAHLELTVEEMGAYKELKASVEYTSHVVAKRNNEETRSVFDESVENYWILKKNTE